MLLDYICRYFASIPESGYNCKNFLVEICLKLPHQGHTKNKIYEKEEFSELLASIHADEDLRYFISGN